VGGTNPNPIPPGGVSAVPAVTVQEEKEDEEAVERARNNFSAYRPNDGGNLTTEIAMLIIVLAAGAAGAGLKARPRRRGAAAYARSEVRRGRDA
jgi:hypothetical protein